MWVCTTCTVPQKTRSGPTQACLLGSSAAQLHTAFQYVVLVCMVYCLMFIVKCLSMVLVKWNNDYLQSFIPIPGFGSEDYWPV